MDQIMANADIIANQGMSRRNFISGGLTGIAAIASSGIVSTAYADEVSESQSDASGLGVNGEGGNTIVATGSATGRMGQILVKVVLEQSDDESAATIESIDIVKQAETGTIAPIALSRIPQMIVQNQSLDVDAVAGATVTSYGVIFAVQDALEHAGIDSDNLTGASANGGQEKGTSSSGLLHEEPISDAEVAIIGGGLAGLTCAARLVEQGHKVVVYEESAHLGGSAPMAAGWISAAGSQLEADCGVEDSAEQYYAYMEDLAAQYGGQIDYPDIVHAYVDNNGAAVDWLDQAARIDLGDRQGTDGIYEKPDTPRIFKANGCGASVVIPLIGLLQQAVSDGKASLVLEARVTRLLTDGNSDTGSGSAGVTGVEVTYADGTVVNRTYDAVVLATGGYGHDVARMKDEGLYTNVVTCNPSTASGHGIELAKEVGAQFVCMDERASYGNAIQNAGDEARYQANIFLPGVIWVDQNGKRMTDESVWTNSFRVWDDAPDNTCYILFSEAQITHGCRPIVVTSYHEGQISPYDSWDLFDSLDGDVTFTADSAGELAEKVGIDADGLSQEIERYNGFVEAGVDDDFDRSSDSMSKLEGKLYAIKTVPYMLMTAGGVKVNPNAEVLDEDGNVIEGLYASGEVLGIRQYAAFTRAGNGLGGAITWGYIAANAVEQKI